MVDALLGLRDDCIKDLECSADDIAFAQQLLEIFVRANYTGPQFESSDLDVKLHLLDRKDWQCFEMSDIARVQQFVCDLDTSSRQLIEREIAGEEMQPLVLHTSFLLISMWIYERALFLNPASGELLTWNLRICFLMQRICTFQSERIYSRLMELIKQIHDNNIESADIHLLEGLIYQYYHQSAKSLESLKLAEQASGLSWTITGRLGKRTKFQQFDIAQLVVEAQNTLSIQSDEPNASDSVVPQSLRLDDDTLLETVELTNADTSISKSSSISAFDQCILLAHCLDFKMKSPNGDELAIEQMQPFIDFLVKSPKNFSIHTVALYIRSKLDTFKKRKVERAIMQIQTLVDQFPIIDKEEGGADFKTRYEFFWQLMLPMRIEMQVELGKQFLQYGMARSALEIYQKLERWEEVIHCYIMMDEFEKAEKCILQQLEVADAPHSRLYCILGDLKNDEQYYWKAWEVSDHHNARAMRSLGALYFKKQQLTESMECYEKAFAINALFENAWFTYGCVAMHLENWEKARMAFSKCVQLEQANGEAWNNLAAINIRLGNKKDAFRSLKEGLKEKYDSWKMWENLLFIALDLCEFSEGMQALDRLLDLEWKKKDSVDIEAVIALTRGTLSQASENQNSRLEEVLTRAAEMHVSLTGLWKCFFLFYKINTNLPKQIYALESAYRAADIDSNIIYDKDTFEELAGVAVDLARAYIEQDEQYKARLIVRKLMKRSNEYFENEKLYGMLEEVLELVK